MECNNDIEEQLQVTDILEEYDTMTDYFTKNKTLNLDDKRFFIDYCPTNNFHDYKFWEQVKEIQSYSFTLIILIWNRLVIFINKEVI